MRYSTTTAATALLVLGTATALATHTGAVPQFAPTAADGGAAGSAAAAVGDDTSTSFPVREAAVGGGDVAPGGAVGPEEGALGNDAACMDDLSSHDEEEESDSDGEVEMVPVDSSLSGTVNGPADGADGGADKGKTIDAGGYESDQSSSDEEEEELNEEGADGGAGVEGGDVGPAAEGLEAATDATENTDADAAAAQEAVGPVPTVGGIGEASGGAPEGGPDGIALDDPLARAAGPPGASPVDVEDDGIWYGEMSSSDSDEEWMEGASAGAVGGVGGADLFAEVPAAGELADLDSLRVDRGGDADQLAGAGLFLQGEGGGAE